MIERWNSDIVDQVAAFGTLIIAIRPRRGLELLRGGEWARRIITFMGFCAFSSLYIAILARVENWAGAVVIQSFAKGFTMSYFAGEIGLALEIAWRKRHQQVRRTECA